MTEVQPEILLGSMGLLLVIGLVLIVFLARAVRRRRSQDVEQVPQSEMRPDHAGPSDPLPTAAAGRQQPSSARSGDPQRPFPQEVAAHVAQTAAPAIDTDNPLRLATADRTQAHRLRSLMQVWQDESGCLVVEIEGQRYRRLLEIQNGDVGRRVLAIIHRLVAFSKGQDTHADALASSLQSARPSTEPELLDTDVAEERAQEIIDSIRRQEQAEPKPSRVTANPIPFRRRSVTEDTAITLNLADEIDQILQVRLSASPAFAGRHIRVTSAPDGRLRLHVDGAVYAALDDVPDTQTRSLIKSAIEEWERRR